RNRAIALLRRGHGFDDVAVERRMVVSEKSDELSAARVAGEEGGLVRFVGGLELPAAFSVRHRAVGEEKAAANVHRKRAGSLLFVGDVGSRSGRDPSGARWQLDDIACSRPAKPDRAESSVRIGDSLLRLEVFHE